MVSCVARVRLGWYPVLRGLGKVVPCVARARLGGVLC